MLMRLLPSHGWTGGLFGRRDRAVNPREADIKASISSATGLERHRAEPQHRLRSIPPGRMLSSTVQSGVFWGRMSVASSFDDAVT